MYADYAHTVDQDGDLAVDADFVLCKICIVNLAYAYRIFRKEMENAEADLIEAAETA